ncbi:bifunctional 3-phenylpropionate/cinnamic acid dioxygenase ferredoxin subunit [Williamsia sterculiae]|uniref:Ferredoxin subunit of nitrite reductase or a ring-hydroxylating dioxygenase n=1 Tax=Williamsia sterculiae TaxID=1344003 RepID=A0A1N7ED15_9NOCA|nr:bifunctional 3-phenylpropionate/cinnamic acid dioxygenase ferredoxin subunit [Williamsia sterculiae]SIR85909.1 Ferredoxin subunit of nitrite reductase or a ring-hydroxylating dioxygenase [Williamsia sterculiae]
MSETPSLAPARSTDASNVDQTSEQATSSTLVYAGTTDSVQFGEALRINPPGAAPIAVFRTDEGFFAIDDTCTHQDASLADGWVEDCTVECPLHEACFDLRTGVPSGPPASRPVVTHAVRVVEGAVYVEITHARDVDAA